MAWAGRWRQVRGDGVARADRASRGYGNGEGEEAVAQVADGGKA